MWKCTVFLKSERALSFWRWKKFKSADRRSQQLLFVVVASGKSTLDASSENCLACNDQVEARCVNGRFEGSTYRTGYNRLFSSGCVLAGVRDARRQSRVDWEAGEEIGLYAKEMTMHCQREDTQNGLGEGERERRAWVERMWEGLGQEACRSLQGWHTARETKSGENKVGWNCVWTAKKNL